MSRYSPYILKKAFVLFASTLLAFSPTIVSAADCEDLLEVFETDPILQITDDYLDCIIKSQTEATPGVIRNLEAFIDTSPETFYKISYKPDQAGVTWSVDSKGNEPLSAEVAERVTDALQNLVIESLKQNKELSPADRKKIATNIQIRIIGGSEAEIVTPDADQAQNDTAKTQPPPENTENELAQRVAENKEPPAANDAQQAAKPGVSLEDITDNLINEWIDKRIQAGDLNEVKDLLDPAPGEALLKAQLTGDGAGGPNLKIDLINENQRVLNPDEEKRAKDAIKKALENALQQHANLTNKQFNNLIENTEIKIREDERVAEKKEQPANNDAEPKDKDAEKLAENEPPQKDAENDQDQQVAEKNKKPVDDDAEPKDKDAEKIAENEQPQKDAENDPDQQLAEKNKKPADDDAEPEDKDGEKIAENEQDQQLAETKAQPAIPPQPAVPFDKLTGSQLKKWLEERINESDLNTVKHLLDLTPGKAPFKVQYTGVAAGGPALEIEFLSANQRQLDEDEQNDAKDAIKKTLENALQQHANLTNEEFKNIIEATEIRIRRTERPPNPILPVVTKFNGERRSNAPNVIDISVELSKSISQDSEIYLAINPKSGSASGENVTITIPAGQTSANKQLLFSQPVSEILHRRRPRATDDFAVVRVKGVSQNILPPTLGSSGIVVVLGGNAPDIQTVSNPNKNWQSCSSCETTHSCPTCRRRFGRR